MKTVLQENYSDSVVETVAETSWEGTCSYERGCWPKLTHWPRAEDRLGNKLNREQSWGAVDKAQEEYRRSWDNVKLLNLHDYVVSLSTIGNIKAKEQC